jgi:UDP-N-acetylglucosamine transferase subunit ALG13
VIFVSVGTNEARFDRMLHAVASLGLDEQLMIQHGHSTPVDLANAEVVDFLPFENMVETIRRARLVVTHAGVGSIMVVLANGKRPIVVPRRRTFGEAVDDHQLQLGRRFAEARLVTLVETPDALGEALEREQGEAPPTLPSASSLAADIGAFLEHAISLRPTAARA